MILLVLIQYTHHVNKQSISGGLLKRQDRCNDKKKGYQDHVRLLETPEYSQSLDILLHNVVWCCLISEGDHLKSHKFKNLIT